MFNTRTVELNVEHQPKWAESQSHNHSTIKPAYLSVNGFCSWLPEKAKARRKCGGRAQPNSHFRATSSQPHSQFPQPFFKTTFESSWLYFISFYFSFYFISMNKCQKSKVLLRLPQSRFLLMKILLLCSLAVFLPVFPQSSLFRSHRQCCTQNRPTERFACDQLKLGLELKLELELKLTEDQL